MLPQVIDSNSGDKVTVNDVFSNLHGRFRVIGLWPKKRKIRVQAIPSQTIYNWDLIASPNGKTLYIPS